MSKNQRIAMFAAIGGVGYLVWYVIKHTTGL
ncbi:hypothetical protein YEEN111655_07655 [Yersinia entomophaga]